MSMVIEQWTEKITSLELGVWGLAGPIWRGGKGEGGETKKREEGRMRAETANNLSHKDPVLCTLDVLPFFGVSFSGFWLLVEDGCSEPGMVYNIYAQVTMWAYIPSFQSSFALLCSNLSSLTLWQVIPNHQGQPTWSLSTVGFVMAKYMVYRKDRMSP